MVLTHKLAIRLMLAIFAKNRRAHCSIIHHALDNQNRVCGSLELLPEVSYSRKVGLPPHPNIKGAFLQSIEEAKSLVITNVS